MLATGSERSSLTIPPEVSRTTEFVPPPEFDWHNFGQWVGATFDWMSGLGKPLALGLPLLALALAGIGYFVVQAAWRIYLIRAWHHRRKRRAP